MQAGGVSAIGSEWRFAPSCSHSDADRERLVADIGCGNVWIDEANVIKLRPEPTATTVMKVERALDYLTALNALSLIVSAYET